MHLAAASDFGRRGSLPHLSYGGWTGPNRSWNASGSSQLSTFGEDAPGEGFKFGSGVPAASAAAASLKAVDIPSISRRSSVISAGKRRADMNAFEMAEAEEAERQRRAFIAATYGGDSKRARERLSIGGVGGTSANGTPGTPGSTNARRQSLMLWERMNKSTVSEQSTQEADDKSSSVPVVLNPLIATDDTGSRRGSLPIAIKGGIRKRRLSQKHSGKDDFDDRRLHDEESSEDDVEYEQDDIARTKEVSHICASAANGRTTRFMAHYDRFHP